MVTSPLLALALTPAAAAAFAPSATAPLAALGSLPRRRPITRRPGPPLGRELGFPSGTPPSSSLGAITGDDRRAAFGTYAPYASDGKVGTIGEVGCPGGGDWCLGDDAAAPSPGAASTPAVPGRDHRAGRGTYSPLHGAPAVNGEVGCPGGGDWCLGEEGGAASSSTSAAAGIGRDRRAERGTYAPDHGTPVGYGEIGCPGGGDWCEGDDEGTSSSSTSSAAAVASKLAGLGGPTKRYTVEPPARPKSYGLGSWKKSPDVGARRPIVAGNWKLNPPVLSEASALLSGLASNFADRDASKPSTPEAVVFPPLPFVVDAAQTLEGSGIKVGAQNAGPNEKGAFTGEVAPSMLASVGCSFVLLGHSERRTLFGETDSLINAALLKCLEQPSLKVILCVGETLEQYESGLLEEVVDAQIRGGLDGVDADALLSDGVVIAYEPVWAIGTGLVATPEQAQAAHVAIRNSLAELYDSGAVAEAVRIQYGGSVTPESIEQLMGEEDVDGALVGGASLDADSFARIWDGALKADSEKRAMN